MFYEKVADRYPIIKCKCQSLSRNLAAPSKSLKVSRNFILQVFFKIDLIEVIGCGGYLFVFLLFYFADLIFTNTLRNKVNAKPITNSLWNFVFQKSIDSALRLR